MLKITNQIRLSMRTGAEEVILCYSPSKKIFIQITHDPLFPMTWDTFIHTINDDSYNTLGLLPIPKYDGNALIDYLKSSFYSDLILIK